MKVSAQYASSHLDELFAAANHREDVEIANDDHESFRLTIVSKSNQAKSSHVLGEGIAEIVLGAGRGELVLPTDEEWRAMKEEDARLVNDPPLMTSGEV